MKKYITLKLIMSLFAAMLLSACASTQQGEAFTKPLKEGDGSAKKAIAVYVEVAPQQREDFLKIMKEVLYESQKEDGCLEYSLWADLNSPNTFFLYEEYKDMDAFKAHQASEHFKKFDAARNAMSTLKMRGKFINVESAVQKRPKKF